MKKILLITALISVAFSSYARIGENFNALKNRLTFRNIGCMMYIAKDDQYRELLELPYRDMFLIMPRDVEHMFLFKRPDAKQTTNADIVDQFDLDGWEIQVTGLKGVSVMECYRRHPFMNPEELGRLLQTLVKDKENVTWITTSDFVKNSESTAEEEEVYDSTEDQLMAHISSVLPKVKNKRVEIEIPKAVTSAAGYNESLVRRMFYEAQQKAFERKNAQVAADRERVAQTTARKTTQERKSLKDSNESKISAASANGATSLNSINIKTEKEPEGSDVKFFTTIPNQDDTALGFNYISTDGTLRARIILTSGNVPLGLLVFDTRFDRLLRKSLDDSYTAQSKLRDEDALKSVSAF